MSEPTVTVPPDTAIKRLTQFADHLIETDEKPNVVGASRRGLLASDIRALLAAVETPAPDTLPNYPDRRLTIDQRADAIKAAHKQGYKEGWNDREGDFLVAKDRVYGPTPDTSAVLRLGRVEMDWLVRGQLPRAQPTYDALEALCARVEALEGEVTRLRNISNEAGLIDPGLAMVAGKPISVLETIIRPRQSFTPPERTPT